MAKPTKAQHELLRWLVQRDHTTGISGGSLIDYYRERWVTQRQLENTRRGKEPTVLQFHLTAGSGKVHAWRRSGGTVLRRLRDDGYADMVEFRWGVPQYDLTDIGIEAGRE